MRCKLTWHHSESVISMSHGYIYALRNELTKQIKVGTTKNPDKRKRDLETAAGMLLQTIYLGKTTGDAYKLESLIHKKLSEYRTIGEWFNCSPKIVLHAIKQSEVQTAHKLYSGRNINHAAIAAKVYRRYKSK